MMVYVKTSSAFFVTLVLLALVSANDSDDPSEKCLSENWGSLMKSCNFITAELKESFWTCVKEMNITVPCMIANRIEAKAWDKCEEEDNKNINMTRKFYDQIDWAGCALNKLGVMEVDTSPVKFDVNKVVAIVQKMDIMKSVPVEDYKENITICNALIRDRYVQYATTTNPSTTPENALKEQHDAVFLCILDNALLEGLVIFSKLEVATLVLVLVGCTENADTGIPHNWTYF